MNRRTLTLLSCTASLILALTDGASAATVNTMPYLFALRHGNFWNYAYTKTPPAPASTAFTLSASRISSGRYLGLYRLGSWRSPRGERTTLVCRKSPDRFSIYNINGRSFDPPLVVNGWQVLNKVTADPHDAQGATLIRRQSLLTIRGRAFRDLLVTYRLDKRYRPNAVNDLLGLDRVRVPYGVTEVSWAARSIGEVLFMDVDCRSGNVLSVYELTGTNSDAVGRVHARGRPSGRGALGPTRRNRRTR